VEMTLREVVQSKAVRVDREAGVIHDVRILGLQSLNKRRYLPEATRRAKGLYEGVHVNADHPGTASASRSIDDKVGWLQGIREDSDGGLSGDLCLLKSDPRFAKIMEAAERRPDLFGLSHNAEGRVRRENGEVLVEEILRVRSVDIVSDPATTRSLFESQEKEKPMAKTLREVFRGSPDRPESKFMAILFEEDPMAAVADVPSEAPAEGGADDQIKAAFRQAIVAAFDDDKLDMQGTLAKMREILKAYDKLNGDGGDGGKSSDGGGDSTTPESVQRELRNLKAELEAHKLLEAAGVDPEEVRVKAVVALESTADRKALIATWKGGAGVGREAPRSQPLRESGSGGPTQFPADNAGFVRAITRV
jgi:hypothetical protein